MSRVFRTAVEVDEYLARRGPGKVEPSPFKDQVDAAQREMIAVQEKVLGNPARWIPHPGLPEWVRLGMYDVVLKWANHQVATCIHQPDFGRPQPVYAAAWKPGVVVCGPCDYLLAVTGAADRTCDGCGHECLGVEHDDGIMPITAFCGPLAYQMGVCTDCHNEMLRVEEQAVQQLNTHENKEKES